MRYSWTQPCCDACWSRINGDRIPHRVIDRPEEVCVHCNQYTTSGIYIRIDPATAPFPTLEK